VGEVNVVLVLFLESGKEKVNIGEVWMLLALESFLLPEHFTRLVRFVISLPEYFI
jgi:hypothetical protein